MALHSTECHEGVWPDGLGWVGVWVWFVLRLV